MGFFDRLLKPNITKLESQGDVEALGKLVESDGRTDVRSAAIEALAGIGAPRAIELLVGLLSDEDPEIVQTAEKAISGLGPGAGETLIGALGGRGADAASRLLLKLGEGAIELLRQASSNQDEAIRRRALGALVELDAVLETTEVRESLFRALLAALGDRSPECRVLAAQRLQGLGDPRASRGLAAQLKDGHEPVREACRHALVMIGEPAVPNLLDALASRNPNSRKMAAGILGEVCGDEVAIGSRRIALLGLVDRATDGDAEIAAAVHRSLEMIPNEAVIAEQLKHLADPESSDHDEIEEFLEQLLVHGGLSSEAKTRIAERMIRAQAERAIQETSS